jgi:hypothetical protein
MAAGPFGAFDPFGAVGSSKNPRQFGRQGPSFPHTFHGRRFAGSRDMDRWRRLDGPSHFLCWPAIELLLPGHFFSKALFPPRALLGWAEIHPLGVRVS